MRSDGIEMNASMYFVVVSQQGRACGDPPHNLRHDLHAMFDVEAEKNGEML